MRVNQEYYATYSAVSSEFSVIENCFGIYRVDLSIQRGLLFRIPYSLRTHELSRLPALESALLAVGGALGELKDGRVHVVLVGPPAVYGFTGHLLVPFTIGTGEGHRGFRLLRGKTFIHFVPQPLELNKPSDQSMSNNINK